MRPIWMILLLAFMVPLSDGCSRSGITKKPMYFDDTPAGMSELTVMPVNFLPIEVRPALAFPATELRFTIETELKKSIEQVIEESFLDVVRFNVTDKMLEDDSELRRHLYEQTIALGRAKKDIIEAGKTEDVPYLGDIDYIADLAGCEYFVFVEGSGWYMKEGTPAEETAAGSVMAFLLPGGAPSVYSEITLAAYVIDATQGKVVWYNTLKQVDVDPRKKIALRYISRQLFEPLLGIGEPDRTRPRPGESIYKRDVQIKPKDMAEVGR